MGDREALAKQAADRGFVTVLVPACRAGGMIIAAAHAMYDAEINYQEPMHVTYQQLALLHMLAIVVHGNARSLQKWEHWLT